MSGGPHHNPHGRQGQPAPGWNHLQVPNFYPRQPQAAHMSSDRPLSHSPLTWHTPTPPDHQKGGNPFRLTPTPPDVQALKAAPNIPYRHTPTPPDRDLKSYRHTPTPPDSQGMKPLPNPLYRHTPTPPDMAHGMKGNVPLYRNTPPPDGHKGTQNPLYNLQQMISDTRGAPRPGDNIRENIMARAENIAYARHSPGLAHGSMDLSVTRSPRNGNQNGEMGTPISLSVRDASKINSLDSAEITKIHQVPLGYTGKSIDIPKPSSPTMNSMNQSSNSPKSPKSMAKRPVKKMDSILERLNSVGDGVVITPVQHTPSPQSVIVSAHSLEDSNSRGSSSSVNITPVLGITPYPVCDSANIERITPPAHHLATHPPVLQENTSISLVHFPMNPQTTMLEKPPTPPMPRSVIMESSTYIKEDPITPSNFSNEDSNGSSSDSSKSKRKRKQPKTSKVENENSLNDSIKDTPNDNISNDETSNIVAQPELENHTPNIVSRVQETVLQEQVVPLQPINENVDTKNSGTGDVPPPERRSSTEDNSVPVVSKTRRKNSSESETLDNIAAMIASTESGDDIAKIENAINDGTLSNSSCLSPKSPHIAMHTEQLKQVLGSPEPESKLEASDMNQLEPSSQPDATPTNKPQRRKRNSRSQSSESSQNDVKPLEETCVDNDSSDKTKPEPSFVEVENELEKMFAGIEEAGPSSPSKTLDPETGVMTNSLNSSEESQSLKKDNPPEKKKRVSRRSSAATSSGILSGEENTPKKKRKSTKRSLPAEEQHINALDTMGNKKSKNVSNLANKNKRDKSKEKNKLELLSHKDAYDSGSNASSSKSRGPYVQIKGPRDSPLSVSVINTPMQDEDGDKPLQKIKTLKTKSSLNSDSDFKNKVKSKGLHSSTLSMKYDSMTTDTSWICVFCKRGPHTGSTVGSAPEGKAQHMGDLFGPYIITTDCPDYTSMISDPQDTLFKGRPKHGTFNQNRQARPPNKRGRAESDEGEKVKVPKEEMYLGMTEAGTNSYEVWVHEDCAVWAPGLYLVGAKVVGLDSAVWGCCAVRCDRCRLLGASLACIKRGCHKTMHVNCARAELWTLSEDNFLVYCKDHGLP